MTTNTAHPVPDDFAQRAWTDADGYEALYAQSIEDPQSFWAEQGKRLDWIRPYSKVKNTCFDKGAVSIRWYEDGQLNVAANCLDRHLETRAEQTAIIWEGDDPEKSTHISTASCTLRSAAWPTDSKPAASARATSSPFTCR